MFHRSRHPPVSFIYSLLLEKAYNYNGDCAYADGFNVLREQFDAVLVQVFC